MIQPGTHDPYAHVCLCGRAGQGSIAPPACVGATPVEGPIDVEEGLPVEMPLVYFSGNVSPDPNPQLYRHHVECMAALLDKRAQTNPHVSTLPLQSRLVWLFPALSLQCPLWT